MRNPRKWLVAIVLVAAASIAPAWSDAPDALDGAGASSTAAPALEPPVERPSGRQSPPRYVCEALSWFTSPADKDDRDVGGEAKGVAGIGLLYGLLLVPPLPFGELRAC